MESPPSNLPTFNSAPANYGAPPLTYADSAASRTPAGYTYPSPADTRAADMRIADARGAGFGAAAGPANPDYQRGVVANQPQVASVHTYAPQVASQPPQIAHAQVADSRAAAPATLPTAALTVATPPNVVLVPQPQPAAPAPAKDAWGPFVVVLFALFFSIGGNLYLGWTALEFHSRYRNAIERLRSAARSS
jgi:hypothetical protein